MKQFTRWPLAARFAAACLGLTAAALMTTRFSPAPAHAAPPVVHVAADLVRAEGDYGTIKGRLVWGGATIPEPKPLDVNKDNAVCGKDAKLLDRKLIVDPKSKGVRWGLAYLVKPKGENPGALEALLKKQPEVVLDQKSCEYLPYVLGMYGNAKDIKLGQTLVLKSSDAVNHNVHLNAFQNEPFNVILPPLGSMKRNLAPERRPMSLTCDIHPWMQAYVMVFDHTFFAVTGEDGSFEIKGVPAGEQKLVLWEPAVGYVTKGAASGVAVTVKAGDTTDMGQITLDPAKVK